MTSMIELAQRLIETPQWRDALFLAPPKRAGRLHRDGEGVLWRKFPSTEWFPDLTDDPTGGKVLGLLRAATTADIKVLLGLGGEIGVSVSVGTMPDPFGGVYLGEAAARALIALAELHGDTAARSAQIAEAKTRRRRWWCSWIAQSGAPQAPLDPAVWLGLWESGEIPNNHGDVALTFLAWIEAETAEAAWNHVLAAYLPHNQTPICRFCEERGEPPQGGRFVL